MRKIEEIARAMAAARVSPVPDTSEDMMAIVDRTWRNERLPAIYALQAMREPTETMGIAGNEALDANGCIPVEDSDAPTCWQAMIDAIIAEAEQEGE